MEKNSNYKKNYWSNFSFRSPEKWFDIVDNTIKGRNKTSYVTSATGRKHYLGEIYPSETFFH